MPNKSGHALSVEVVSSQKNIVVIVHTEVKRTCVDQGSVQCMELTMCFTKPADYSILGLKAMGLVERNRSRTQAGISNAKPMPEPAPVEEIFSSQVVESTREAGAACTDQGSAFGV